MQKIYKYKQNKREASGAIRQRTKNRFTLESIENKIVKLKSHNISVAWYEYAPVEEIEEVTHINNDYGNLP